MTKNINRIQYLIKTTSLEFIVRVFAVPAVHELSTTNNNDTIQSLV